MATERKCRECGEPVKQRFEDTCNACRTVEALESIQRALWEMISMLDKR